MHPSRLASGIVLSCVRARASGSWLRSWGEWVGDSQFLPGRVVTKSGQDSARSLDANGPIDC
jgi:hypothetical protein